MSEESTRNRWDVFLAYVHQDQEVASALFRELEGQGFRVWFDRQTLRAGDAWTEEVQQRIEEAKVLLVLWSPAAARSKGVVAEIELTLKRQTELPAEELQVSRAEERPARNRVAAEIFACRSV